MNNIEDKIRKYTYFQIKEKIYFNISKITTSKKFIRDKKTPLIIWFPLNLEIKNNAFDNIKVQILVRTLLT